MALDLGKLLATKKEEHEDAAEVVNLISKQLFKLRLYFQWYLFQRLPIYYVYKTNRIAWVDGLALYVSKKFLDMSSEMQLFVIRHELYHIAFQHTFQTARKLAKAKTTLERNTIKITYNVIQDAVINGIIVKENETLNLGTPSGFIIPEMVNDIIEGDVVKLGFVNAAEKLLYFINKGVVKLEAKTPDGRAIDLSKHDIDNELSKHGRIIVRVINTRTGKEFTVEMNLDTSCSCGAGGSSKEGGEFKDKNTYRGGEGRKKLIKRPVSGMKPRSPEDVYKLVKEAVDFEKYRRVSDSRKVAGIGVAGDALYELMSVGAKKPEWEAILTSTLTNFISQQAVVSWHFVNRRAPFEKPGIRYLSYPDVHILLDVSGSMLDDTLEKALKRVIYIVENYPEIKVKLYQWSGACTLPEDIDRRFAENLRKYKKLPVMTGGTEIEPALDMALKYVTKKDAVVILTDGAIFDIEKQSVKEKFKKLVAKAGIVIFGSLGYIPEHLPPQVKKIRLED